MKKSSLLALICVALGLAQTASAQYRIVGAIVHNSTYEDGVFGATAATSCILAATGSPSWTSPSAFPISRSSGQTATWGYANGTSGSTITGGSTSSYQLSNVAFRNVVRGSSNNGGVYSGFTAEARIKNTTNASVEIWGHAKLSLFGVTGAQNYYYEVYLNGNRTGLGWASSGQTSSWSSSTLNPNIENIITVVVFADAPGELGSVLVNFNP